MPNQTMIPVAASPAASFDGQFGLYFAAADGTISVDVRDVGAALLAGWLPAIIQVRQATLSAPPAASATAIVANVTTTNVALTIAAQPTVPRQLSIVSAPGSPGITAGNLAVVYTANDGTTQTDNFSLIGAATATFVTSKGCLQLTSATVSGLVGGTSPTIQIGTNAVLAVPIQQNAQDPLVLRETLDAANVAAGSRGTLTATGLYTPTTAPNGTHNWVVDYSFLAAA